MNLTIPIKLEVTDILIDMCRKHPTCEGCCFREEYKGCYFRSKTPKEWRDFKEDITRAERENDASEEV